MERQLRIDSRTTDEQISAWYCDARDAYAPRRLLLTGHPQAIARVIGALTRRGARVAIDIAADPAHLHGYVDLAPQEPQA